ncbi:unnamed protein product, partial [Chrysoparadoxa australica]
EAEAEAEAEAESRKHSLRRVSEQLAIEQAAEQASIRAQLKEVKEQVALAKAQEERVRIHSDAQRQVEAQLMEVKQQLAQVQAEDASRLSGKERRRESDPQVDEWERQEGARRSPPKRDRYWREREGTGDVTSGQEGSRWYGQDPPNHSVAGFRATHNSLDSSWAEEEARGPVQWLPSPYRTPPRRQEGRANEPEWFESPRQSPARWRGEVDYRDSGLQDEQLRLGWPSLPLRQVEDYNTSWHRHSQASGGAAHEGRALGEVMGEVQGVQARSVSPHRQGHRSSYQQEISESSAGPSVGMGLTERDYCELRRLDQGYHDTSQGYLHQV